MIDLSPIESSRAPWMILRRPIDYTAPEEPQATQVTPCHGSSLFRLIEILPLEWSCTAALISICSAWETLDYHSFSKPPNLFQASKVKL
jgi:hypothetical protein